ncbi:MAG: hypothetical protein ACD_71C00130G0013 [uncultured bacterium (gcode 4)]|uniref:Uncharacterized protein n=1 Tax=uncultured bacterium (gcode 4) TaxID=1234023 RepID=K1Z585_9BACT|nr:MAG: hypothetical protein ACD_71C00130G0013 [uncultured bacterium (gcode 4)]
MKRQDNKRPILIGEVQSSLIQEDTKLLSIDYSQFKAAHGAVCWKSGAGKTRALTSVLFWTMKNSIISHYEDLSKEPDSYIVCDPHNSNLPPLLSLLKDFYAEHPEYSRTSHIQNFKKRSSDPDGKSIYKGHYVEKTLIFNPLASKRLASDSSYLDKAVNLNVSALKSIFDFSSFWPRNTEAIEWVIRACLFINAHILRTAPNEPLITYKHIYWLFDTLKKTGKLPLWVNSRLKEIFESAIPNQKDTLEAINSHLKGLIAYQMVNKEYFDTTITKFKDFSGDLWYTFWYWSEYSDLTLDLEIVYWATNLETNGYFLDLSAFSNQERQVIIAFFYSASYFIWSLKDHQKALGASWTICDEFRSFLILKGEKNYLIDLLEKWLNENRKHFIFYLFVLQSVSRELKDLFNNFWYIFVFALPPDQAEFFSDILSFWIAGSPEEKVITEKHICNLQRWSFIASFDTVEYWLLTVMSKSLDMNDPKIRKALIG